LIVSLTETNQSLLNQVRARDIGALSGLQSATLRDIPNDEYMSTDDRELLAWQQSMAANHELGEVEFDEEDLMYLRSGL